MRSSLSGECGASSHTTESEAPTRKRNASERAISGRSCAGSSGTGPASTPRRRASQWGRRSSKGDEPCRGTRDPRAMNVVSGRRPRPELSGFARTRPVERLQKPAIHGPKACFVVHRPVAHPAGLIRSKGMRWTRVSSHSFRGCPHGQQPRTLERQPGPRAAPWLAGGSRSLRAAARRVGHRVAERAGPSTTLLPGLSLPVDGAAIGHILFRNSLSCFCTRWPASPASSPARRFPSRPAPERNLEVGPRAGRPVRDRLRHAGDASRSSRRRWSSAASPRTSPTSSTSRPGC